MLRAIKLRLYPNMEQEQAFNKLLGCYRFVYNQMLALKQNQYNENKKSLSLIDLSKYFHGDPRLFKANDTPNFYNKNMTAKEMWNLDNERKK